VIIAGDVETGGVLWVHCVYICTVQQACMFT